MIRFLLDMGPAQSTGEFLRSKDHDVVHLREQGLELYTWEMPSANSDFGRWPMPSLRKVRCRQHNINTVVPGMFSLGLCARIGWPAAGVI